MRSDVLDIAGVGFGPSNLALAVCLEEMGVVASARFLDAQPEVGWQSQMMLDGSDIQNNPLRDLVTPRNPRSYYGFINYLKLNGRLFEYLNLPTSYPLRREYANYVRWVAGHFEPQVRSGVRVERLAWADADGGKVWEITDGHGGRTLSRSLVLGTGRTPNIPGALRPVLGPRVFHLNNYLERIEALPPTATRIAVLGASQSAVEILLDLMARYPSREIYSIQRGFGFRLKDVSPFSDRVYFPEFVDYFYDLPPEGKANISRQLRGTNYSAADADVIDALYVKIYEEGLSGKHRFHLVNNTEIVQARLGPAGAVELGLREVNRNRPSDLAVDALVLATGFLDLSGGASGERFPPLLAPFADELDLEPEEGVLRVGRDYRVGFTRRDAPPAFLNGLCESSHGFGDAGSFSLLSLRSETIALALQRALGLPTGSDGASEEPLRRPRAVA